MSTSVISAGERTEKQGPHHAADVPEPLHLKWLSSTQRCGSTQSRLSLDWHSTNTYCRSYGSEMVSDIARAQGRKKKKLKKEKSITHEFGNGTGSPLRTCPDYFVGRHEAAQPEPPISRTSWSRGYCSSVPGYWAFCKAKYIRQGSVLCLYGVWPTQHMGKANMSVDWRPTVRFTPQSPLWRRDEPPQYIFIWVELSWQFEGLGKIFLACIFQPKALLAFWISRGKLTRNKTFTIELPWTPQGLLGRLAQELKGSKTKCSDEFKGLNTQLGLYTQRSKGSLWDFYSKVTGYRSVADWKPNWIAVWC